jgi:hypothetical protein
MPLISASPRAWPELQPHCHWLFDFLHSKKGRSAKEAAPSLHLHAVQQTSDIGGAFLRFLFRSSSGLHRKLKYGCFLTLT